MVPKNPNSTFKNRSTLEEYIKDLQTSKTVLTKRKKLL
jgi:hypothetical protein